MESTKKLTRGGLVLLAAALATALCVAWAAVAPAKAYAYGITQSAATTNSATITWEDPYEGSTYGTTTGYTVMWGADSQSATNKVTLPADQTSYVISGLKAGTEYYAKVEYTYTTKYNETPQTSTVGSSYDVATRVTTPTGVKQVKWWYWAKSVEFTWNKQTAADKVQYKVVRTDTKKTVANETDTYPSTSYSVNKVSNSIIYTVQMRVHDKWGWSAWSKAAYLFTQPMANENKTKVKNGALTVAWNKVKGATSYTVYASTKEKSGYKKVKTVSSSKTSLSFKKIGKTKINAKKTYYVYVVANKKVGKTTYTSGRLYTCKVKGAKAQTLWTF